ncbi:hypothetical protein TcCL_NonESM07005 [Trypanosoma cruzi]|nr:hypothetical protein TcCL_NonESM07005 [Trypanosoma cruzi]
MEVPEEVGVDPSPQCGRDGTTDIKSHLQSVWHVPVSRGVDRRSQSAAFWSARSGGAHVGKRSRRRQSTDAVPTAPQHSRSQRAGTWRRHASGHHRPWDREGTKLFRTDL